MTTPPLFSPSKHYIEQESLNNMPSSIHNKTFPITRTFELLYRFAKCDFCQAVGVACISGTTRGSDNDRSTDICFPCIKELAEKLKVDLNK